MTTTRFAPSPTGYLHIGNLRAAIFNYAIARKSGGTFILRLDDTDPERSTVEFADAIKEDLSWLGLTWDRVETQSSRLERYTAAAERLKEMGRLYECFETRVELDLKRKKQLNMGKPPVYDRAALALSEDEKQALRKERAGHWRFKLDLERIEWTDGILGDLSIDAASLSDPVLIREDGQFLYTLASVVDDTEMGITDVVRGSDHVTNTATQIQIIQALGGEVPRFAHHSLLTGPQGEGLSKRLGTLSLRDLRAQGFEPMAVLSHMARLGSADPIEVRSSVEEIVEGFDLSTFGAPPTKFDVADLGPLSARIVSGLGVEAVSDTLAKIGVPEDMRADFWDMVHENISTREEAAVWWDICQNGATPEVAEDDADFIKVAFASLPPRPWTKETWGEWTGSLKADTGRKGKALFKPLRMAITGKGSGPDMGLLLPLLKNTPEI